MICLALAMLASCALAGRRQDLLASIWGKIEVSQYSSLPSWDGRDLTSPSNMLKLGFSSMDASFDTNSNELPPGRVKYVHPLGTVAKVKYVSKTSRYTGMFNGADSCLTRLSLAINPGSKFSPGMAIKCFTDNSAYASVNFISMFSLDGQGENFNFFANEFSNLIQPSSSILLRAVEAVTFRRASSCPANISLKQFASVDQGGKDTGSASKWPVQIWLKPTGQANFPTTKGREFRNDLATIPVGTALWNVEVNSNGSREVIGSIVTTSRFISSSHGDDVLFFQHSRGENDNCPGTSYELSE